MIIYGELNPMPEQRTQLAFKGKGEHIAMANMLNMAYPNQHINIEITHGLRDYAIVRNTAKITFNLEIELTDKASNIVNNVGRALVKKLLMLGLKEIDTINKADVYNTYKGLYLSEKEREGKLRQGIIRKWFKSASPSKKGLW